MNKRQDPSELIWEITPGCDSFAELRGFYMLDTDDWVLEVLDEDGDWAEQENGAVRLRCIRADAE